MFNSPQIDGSRNNNLIRYSLIAAATLAVSVLLILPIILHEFLPLVDIPNHIARHYISALNGSDANVSRYYEFKDTIAPNAAIDLIHSFINWNGDPYLVARLSMGAYLINFLVSVLVLNRVLTGTWNFWPLTAALVAYNASFFWGFENYVFSVPLVIYGIAFWFALDARPVWMRVIVFGVYSTILIFMHFFAFFIFAVAVFGRELQVLFSQPRGYRVAHLWRNIALALPFLLPLVSMMLQAASEENIDGDVTKYGGLITRFSAIFSLVKIVPFDETIAGQSGLEIAVLLFLFSILLFVFRKNGLRLKVAEKMIGPLLAVLLTCILIPAWIDGVAYVHIRFPFVFVALLVAGTRWQNISPSLSVLLAAVVSGLIVGRVWFFNELSAHHSAEVKNLIRVLDRVPTGSRILPLIAKENGPKRTLHLEAYAIVERQSFIPTMFQGTHSLVLKPEWDDYAHPWLRAITVEFLVLPISEQMRIIEQKSWLVLGHAYWLGWEQKFTHVLMMNPTSIELEKEFPLTLIRQLDGFSLYKVQSN